MSEQMRPSPGSLSGRIFAALAGSYPYGAALHRRAIEVYDQFRSEIPATYSVRDLMDAGVKIGCIRRCADGSWLVVAGVDAGGRERS